MTLHLPCQLLTYISKYVKFNFSFNFGPNINHFQKRGRKVLFQEISVKKQYTKIILFMEKLQLFSL
jgi:hypothetical protein